MRKVLTATVAGLMLAFGLALIASPAQAVVNCTTPETYKAKVTNWPDRGAQHNYWALKSMTRTFLVCPTGEPQNGTVTYRATVADAGTFVTKEGATPAQKVPTPAGEAGPLAAGIKGRVNGGFSVTFTGPEKLVFSTPTLPASGYLENSDWVTTAFTGATQLTFTNYKWTYATDCESFRDDNDNYYGDITSKCATPKAVTQANVKGATCTSDGVLTYPTAEGVIYDRTPKTGAGVIKVTATADEGYVLVKGARKWFVTIPEKLAADSAACKPTPPPPGNGGGGVVTPPSPNETPSETPLSPVANELPVTGEKGNPVLFFSAISGLLLSAGAILLLAARRRKVA